MKKIMLVIAVLVITSISIIFSKNIKAFIQGENQSLNKSIYNFLEDVGNRKNVYGTAIDLK